MSAVRNTQGAEFDDLWTEAPLGYTPPPGRIIMCLGEASCDAPYRGENGTRYYCRRPPGHADAAGHDCPADREDRAARAVCPPDLPVHRTEAGYPNCSTCDGGGCLDCTDPA